MVYGIDVSHHQNKIDWKKVKESGVEFAIIKASEATAFVDRRYKENVKGARENGILVGSYHFARANNPEKEADFFLETVGEIKQNELLALDWEIDYKLPAEWCLSFLQRVESKVGFKPLLYTNEARVKSIDWTPVVKGNYGLWVAKYPLVPIMKPTSGQWDFWVLWQYTSKGKVNGISGNVDLNKNDKITLETLKKYGKQEKCTHCPVHCV